MQSSAMNNLHYVYVVSAPIALISAFAHIKFCKKCVLAVIINEIESEKQILVLKIDSDHVKCHRYR